MRQIHFAFRWIANEYVLLTIAIFFWAFNVVLGRDMRNELSPLAMSFWRWVVAFLCALPLVFRSLPPLVSSLQSRWLSVIALGVLGAVIPSTGCYFAVQYTEATNALILNSFQPVIVVLMSWAILNSRVGAMQLVGVVVSLVGTMVIVTNGSILGLLTQQFNIGDLIMLGATLSWAAYTVWISKFGVIAQPIAFLAVISIVGVLAIAPFYLWEAFLSPPAEITGKTIAFLLFSGIGATFLSYAFYNRAVQRLGPARVAIFNYVSPIIGLALSSLYLGEEIDLHHVTGILLILTGIMLGTASRKIF